MLRPTPPNKITYYVKTRIVCIVLTLIVLHLHPRLWSSKNLCITCPKLTNHKKITVSTQSRIKSRSQVLTRALLTDRREKLSDPPDDVFTWTCRTKLPSYVRQFLRQVHTNYKNLAACNYKSITVVLLMQTGDPSIYNLNNVGKFPSTFANLA